MNQTPASTARAVRSFVIRGGRITVAQERALQELWPQLGVDFADAPLSLPAAQERALQELWPQLGVDFADAPLSLPALFGNHAPCTVEIGFGNGEHLLARAEREPQRNFLGIEVHPPGVGRLLLHVQRLGLRNVRISRHDAVEVLRHQLAPASVDEFQILFPDPWHKKRHHKRRLIDPQFVALLASRLRPGGRLALATDWEPYAEQMLEVLGACTLLLNTVAEGGYAPRPESRVPTRFERRGVGRGHVVRDLLWERRS